MELHEDAKYQYACIYCPKLYTNKYSLNKHMVKKNIYYFIDFLYNFIIFLRIFIIITNPRLYFVNIVKKNLLIIPHIVII